MVRRTFPPNERMGTEPETSEVDSPSTSESSSSATPLATLFERRHCVFSETLDPESELRDYVPKVYLKSPEDAQLLSETMRGVFLFNHLTDEGLTDVVDSMSEVHVDKNETIIVEGEVGRFFYIVKAGVYEACKLKDGKLTQVQTYVNRGYFGDLALLYYATSPLTIRATTDGVLWALEGKTFRRIMSRETFRKRKIRESFIQSVPILQELTLSERLTLVEALVRKNYEDGESITNAGDPADGMFFVADGSVRIVNADKDETNQLPRGSYFGELALLTKLPRKFSAYAVGKVELAFMPVDAFERILGPCVNIMKRNMVRYEILINRIFGGSQDLNLRQ